MSIDPLETPGTEPRASRGTELLVERAIRAAARAGNRLLAAAVVDISVTDAAQRRVLEQVLRAMGARLGARPGTHIDFRFVDHVGARAGNLECGTENCTRLPVVEVGVTDESLQNPRESDPAARIRWAAAGLPATARLAKQVQARAQTAAGNGEASDADNGTTHRTAHGSTRIAVSLVLEPKTAALAVALAAAGCEVAVFSACSETDPAVAAALARQEGVTVFAPLTAEGAAHTIADQRARDAARARIDADHAAAVLDWQPDYLIDDGSHLIRLAHTEKPAALTQLRGAAEETTSGVRPLLEMAAGAALGIPVISVNDARTKTGFDNLIGTGQSCVFAIADLLDGAAGVRASRGVRGTLWTVIGYGPVGVGVARFAAALGAQVTVVERDPVRALAALHDGHEAATAAAALPTADVVVSATGVWHTVTSADFELMRPGTAVAVAGGIDDELALDSLRQLGWQRRMDASERNLEQWLRPDGQAGPVVLAEGGGVNYTAAEGNPIEVMDLSFATQLSALLSLMTGTLTAGVHPVTAADERRVAHAALEVAGGAVEMGGGDERVGGAAQSWRVHRYRHRPPAPGDSRRLPTVPGDPTVVRPLDSV